MSFVKLRPFVYWAQNGEYLFLKVEIRNVVNPSFTLSPQKFNFESVGDGSTGTSHYGFTLDLYRTVKTNSLVKKISDSKIEISIQKDGEEFWWPRLIQDRSRPSWLKLDFDKWKDPEAQTSEDEYSQEAMEKKMANETVKKLMADFGNDQASPAFNLNLTPTYLITYNIAMFLGYLLIVIEMIHGYSRHGEDYFAQTWHDIAPKLKCCQIAQFFEVFHALLRMTRTSWKASLLQCTGRFFILFIILGSEPRMQDKPFVLYLFMVWSLIEIFRYPYYALAVKGRSLNVLTWLRYNMWIPLYPLGAFIEAVIMIRSFPYYDETGKYSIHLPNRWNVSFDFGLFVKLFLLFVFCPGVIFLLKYMRKQRVTKLSKMNKEGRKKLE